MKAHFAVGALCAAVAIGNSAAAMASPADGPYLRLEGGLSLPGNLSTTNTTGPSFALAPKDGPIAGGAIGLRLAPFSIEIGADWMHATLTGSAPSLSGSAQNIPVMMNAYLDLMNGSRIEPYIGFGLGVTSLSLTAKSPSGSRLIDSSAHSFAFQPIIGVDFALTDRLSVGLQYRYVKSVDPWLTTTSGQRISVNNASHNVLATLTYHFFAPAASSAGAEIPAAMPAAAPALSLAPQPPAAAPLPPSITRAEPRMFFVFFDFDSARLTAAGKRAAAEAIASYRQEPSNAIVVRGFTDLVGSDAYNLELSKRRALAVYNYFAAHGVKPTDMGIDWKGKADPRVQTTKREPQNRRVEIRM